MLKGKAPAHVTLALLRGESTGSAAWILQVSSDWMWVTITRESCIAKAYTWHSMIQMQGKTRSGLKDEVWLQKLEQRIRSEKGFGWPRCFCWAWCLCMARRIMKHRLKATADDPWECLALNACILRRLILMGAMSVAGYDSYEWWPLLVERLLLLKWPQPGWP